MVTPAAPESTSPCISTEQELLSPHASDAIRAITFPRRPIGYSLCLITSHLLRNLQRLLLQGLHRVDDYSTASTAASQPQPVLPQTQDDSARVPATGPSNYPSFR